MFSASGFVEQKYYTNLRIVVASTDDAVPVRTTVQGSLAKV